MKKWFTLVLGLAVMMPLKGEKIGDLPHVLKPSNIMVHENLLYVVEDGIVHRFTMKPFKYIGKFGTKGEGPQEFPRAPRLRIAGERLFAEVFGKKIMFFTTEGQFIKEQRVTTRHYGIVPIGNNYVGQGNKFDREKGTSTRTVEICNSKLEPLKILDQVENPPFSISGNKIKVDAVQDFFGYVVSKDKIFVGNTLRGYYVGVYDFNGQKLYEIKKKYNKRAVSQQYKGFFIDRLKTERNWEQIRERIDFRFRDYFPAYSSISIDGQKLYIHHIQESESERKATILDLKGNFIHEATFRGEIRNYSYWTGGKIYYLEENEDEETWELHVEDIK